MYRLRYTVPLVVGGMSEQRGGEQRAELSARQRAEIARLIAEIDRVQEETASSLEQSRIAIRESRRRQQEEEAELIRESQRRHRRFVLLKWTWLKDRLLHRVWLRSLD